MSKLSSGEVTTLKGLAARYGDPGMFLLEVGKAVGLAVSVLGGSWPAAGIVKLGLKSAQRGELALRVHDHGEPAFPDERGQDEPLSPAEREVARRMGRDPKILDRMGECNSLSAYRAIKAGGVSR